MAKTNKKTLARKRRQYKVRKKVLGTADRPRISVFRSAKHIYAQIINDDYEQFNIDNPPGEGENELRGSITICSTSSLDKDLGLSNGGNVDAAKRVGEEIAKLAKEKNVTQVIFDRNGFLYHGRVKALAEAVRETGLLK
jgi:large subunit ribosomal protein L18